MTYFFLELLIFFWLTLVDIYYLEFISHHLKEMLYVNTWTHGNQLWNKNKYFHLLLILMLKKPVFNIKLKSLCVIFNFSQFHEHNIRGSLSQMFLTIGTLKNSAILWIKEKLQQMCFPLNIFKFLTTAFLKNNPGGCFCIFFKAILQRCLNKCTCHDVIFFSSQHILDASFDVLKVELACL